MKDTRRCWTDQAQVLQEVEKELVRLKELPKDNVGKPTYAAAPAKGTCGVQATVTNPEFRPKTFNQSQRMRIEDDKCGMLLVGS